MLILTLKDNYENSFSEIKQSVVTNCKQGAIRLYIRQTETVRNRVLITIEASKE